MKKFVFDTDMGIDDALALLMILGYPEAEVKAVTSVVGNVPLAQATHNVGVVLDAVEAPSIPIYQGCGRPLLQFEPEDAVELFGHDGLGGTGKAEHSRVIESEHASLALVRLARENPGELTLLTLGPLTNIALAIRLNPNFLSNWKQIFIMAGSVDARGNTTPPTEFNVSVDPEAAKIVFEACRELAQPIWLISWEASLTNAVSFEAWDRLIVGDTPAARFIQTMSIYFKETLATWGYSGYPWADPLAAAVALEPALVLNYEQRSLEVETGHNLARGQTIVDYRLSRQTPPYVNIVRDVDTSKFHELLRYAVLACSNH